MNINEKLAYAKEQLDKKNYVVALELYESILQVTPSHPEALLGKAKCLYYSGREFAARFYFSKAVSIEPRLEQEVTEILADVAKPPSPPGLAREFVEKFKEREAVLTGAKPKKYEQLAELNAQLEAEPNNASLWFKKGMIWSELGMYKEAVKCFDTVTELNPTNKNAWLAKADAHKALGQLRDASLSYLRALKCVTEIEVGPEAHVEKETPAIPREPSPEIIMKEEFRRGLLPDHATSQDRKLLFSLDEALAREPTNPNLWFRKGLLLSNYEIYREALKCFDRATELNPNNKTAWISKADAYKKLGQLTEASLCYLMALKCVAEAEGKLEMVPEVPAVTPTLGLEETAKKLDLTELELEHEKAAPEPIEIKPIPSGEQAIIAPSQPPQPEIMRERVRIVKTAVPLRRAEIGYGREQPLKRGLTNGRLVSRPARGRGAIVSAFGEAHLTLSRGRINGMINGRGRINGLIGVHGRINGLVNGRGRINGVINGRRGHINGRINGMTNGRGHVLGRINGLVNGRGVSEMIVFARRRYVGPEKLGLFLSVLSLALLIGMSMTMLYYSGLKGEGITIDGSFEDWKSVEKFVNLAPARPEPNIAILNYGVDTRYNTLSVYIQVKGKILSGAPVPVNTTDTFLLFIDADLSPRTGYLVEGLGAEFLAQVYGRNGVVVGAQLLRYSPGSKGLEWNWTALAGIPAVAGVDRLEFQLPGHLLGKRNLANEKINLYLRALNWRDEESSTHVFSTTPGELFVIQKSIGTKLVGRGKHVKMLSLKFQAANSDIILEQLRFTKLGNANPSSVRLETSDGDEGWDALVKNGEAVFHIGKKFVKNQSLQYILFANLEFATVGNTIGFKLSSPYDIKTSTGAVNLNSELENNVMYIIRPPDTVVIDGAFGDWYRQDIDIHSDRRGDVGENGSKNIDIVNYAVSKTNTTLSFYLKVDAVMLGGCSVPWRNDFVVRGPVQRPPVDSDRDTVPDEIEKNLGELLPYDFNNDNITDDLTNNDVDADGERDYPYGPDLWLNTTLPWWYPQEWAGKNVSVFIGPAPPGPGAKVQKVETGEDYAYIFIDSDGNASTGYFLNEPVGYSVDVKKPGSPVPSPNSFDTSIVGADYVVLVTGKYNMVNSSKLYKFEAGNWTVSCDVPVGLDARQLEVGVLASELKLGTNVKVYFRTSDWKNSEDSSELEISTEKSYIAPLSRVTSKNNFDDYSDPAWSSDKVWKKQPITPKIRETMMRKVDDSYVKQTKNWEYERIDQPISKMKNESSMTENAKIGSSVVAEKTNVIRTKEGFVITDSKSSIKPLADWANAGWIRDRQVEAVAGQEDRQPNMAADKDGRIYMTFRYYDTGYAKYAIAVLRSTNGGDSWSGWKITINSGYNQAFPTMAISLAGTYGDRIFVAAEREYSTSDRDIWVAYCDIANWGGASPWTFVWVDNDAGDDRFPWTTVSYTGTTWYVHVAYQYAYSATDRDIYHKSSTDGGATWTAYNIDTTTYDDRLPVIAWGNAGRLYCIYCDGDDIYMRRSDDYGATWTTLAGKGWNPGTGVANIPSVAATHFGASDFVVVAFQYPVSTDNDICYDYSSDSGGTWTGSIYYLDFPTEDTCPVLNAEYAGGTSTYVGLAFNAGDKIRWYERKSGDTAWRYWQSEQCSDNAASADTGNLPGFTYDSANYPNVCWGDQRTAAWDIRFTTLGADYTIKMQLNDVDQSWNFEVSGGNGYYTGTWTATKTFNWIAGYTFTITVPNPYTGGHTFVKWTKDGTDFSTSTTINIGASFSDLSDHTFIAKYIPEFSPHAARLVSLLSPPIIVVFIAWRRKKRTKDT